MSGDASSYGPPRDEAEWTTLRAITALTYNTSDEDCRAYFQRPDPSDVRVFRRDGRVVGGLRVFAMGQAFGSRMVGSGGVAAVAVAPEYRGRGAATGMMSAMLGELHERGVALSVLYPSTWGLYRGVGYEPAGSLFEISLDPRPLGRPDSELEVRPIEASDQAAVREVARRWACHQDGHLDRCEYLWAHLLDARKGAVAGYLVQRDGEVEGYLYYRQKMAPGADLGQLRVSDVAFLTPGAGRRLLAFLAQHGTLNDRVLLWGSAAHPLLSMLAELHFKARLVEHWMLRVVDVPRALEERGYARWLTGELHLAVHDEVLPANDGRFVLRVEDGRGTVEPGGDGRLSLDVRGLAPLYSGHLSAAGLRVAGLLQASDDDCAAAGALFAGPAPTMPDIF